MQEEKYYLYDLYDGCWDLIDTFDSEDAATEAAREYEVETDGECDLLLMNAPVSDMALAQPGTILYGWRY